MAKIKGTSSNDNLVGILDPEYLLLYWDNNGNPVYQWADADDTFYGYQGNDTMTAYDQIFNGWYSEDTMYGGPGNDTLYAGRESDTLYGEDGNDLLYGGGEKDYMIGGMGDDSYEVRDSTDEITELNNQGVDTVYSTLSFGLGPYIEHIVLLDPVNGRTATGNTLNNDLIGSAANDTLNGMSGDDSIWGENGSDLIHGGTGNDRITGGGGKDTLKGEQNADLFYYFGNPLDSPVGVNRDIISDFNASEGDKIDISSIDANVNIAGNQPFTVGSYVNGILFGDVIGSSNDFSIELTGAPALTLGVHVIL